MDDERRFEPPQARVADIGGRPPNRVVPSLLAVLVMAQTLRMVAASPGFLTLASNGSISPLVLLLVLLGSAALPVGTALMYLGRRGTTTWMAVAAVAWMSAIKLGLSTFIYFLVLLLPSPVLAMVGVALALARARRR